MTLSRRLLLLMLAVLLPTAALFGWTVVATYDREVASERAQLRETARALALVVDGELDKRAAIARTLAATTGLAEGDHQRFYDEARAATAGTGDWVVLMDPGYQLVNTGVPFGQPLPARRWQPERPWEADTRPRASNLAMGALVNEPLLGVYVPVLNMVPMQLTVGVVFRPSALQKMLGEQHLPEGWRVVILDGSRTVVARSPFNANAVGQHATSGMSAAIDERAEGFFDSSSMEGVPVRAFYSRSPVYGWTFVIAVPQAMLTAAARHAVWASGVSAALLALLAVVLAIWAAAGIRRPMLALKRAADDLAQDRLPDIAPTGLPEADAVGMALRRAGEQSAQINEQLERRVAEALAAARDAQAQTEVLQRLLAEELLNLITDNLPVLISYVDRHGRYRLNNKAYEAWFGLPRSSITGQRARDLIGEDNYHHLMPFMSRAMAGETVAFETETHYPAVGRRWVETSYIPHAAADGTIDGVAVLVHDITDRRQASDELHRLNAELAAADRRKDEFLATLAHELRNPLAPITSALEILRRKSPPDPAMRWTRDVIDRQVRQMTRLVDDLLDVARITRGRIELRCSRVDLAAIVTGAVEAARPLIEGAGHALAVSLPPRAIWLQADPVRLTQVLSNLLTNAAKYTPQGGRIEIAAEVVAAADADVDADAMAGEPSPAWAQITVSDNGIGLEPAHLAAVFEMFSQVAPALDRSQGGLGIGLALARGLVEQHGGAISARSDGLDRGSSFIVRLPLAPDVAPLQAEPMAADPPPGVALRVLVVDDNRDAADSLAMLLTLQGHDVCVANDGSTALRMAEGFGPAIVLLDIGMPGMNGYEVARRLRDSPEGARMTLAALTGWGQQDDKRRALEAGFDHHLTKPVDGAQLEAVLAASVAARGLRTAK